MNTRLVMIGAGGLGLLALAAGPALASTTTSSGQQKPIGGVVGQVLPALQGHPSSQPSAQGGSPGSSGAPAPASSGDHAGPGPTGAASTAAPGDNPAAGASSASSDYNASAGAYTPPLHGTQPHGEGTGLALNTEPQQPPQPSDCDTSSSGEQIIVGRSCGQQNSDGSYSGHVTVLALGGQELLGESSTSTGSTTTGSLAPIAGPALSQLNSALSQVCAGSGGDLCLKLLVASSSTSSAGSSNSFQAADASAGGPKGLSASALSSSGSISQNSSCQTASGSSSVATASAGGTTLANLANSNDSSRACRNRSQDSQTSSSQALSGALAAITSPIVGAGCSGGTPNTDVKPFGQVPLPAQAAEIVCNATDSDGAQAAAPYGTNTGLAAVILSVVGLEAPSSESLARAPSAPAAATPPPAMQTAASTAPPAAPRPALVVAAAVPGSSKEPLAFTGFNLILGVLIAFALIGAGAVAWAASRRGLA